MLVQGVKNAIQYSNHVEYECSTSRSDSHQNLKIDFFNIFPIYCFLKNLVFHPPYTPISQIVSHLQAMKEQEDSTPHLNSL